MSDPFDAADPGSGVHTRAVHGPGTPRGPGDPVVPAEIRSSTFFGGGGASSELIYGRYGNAPHSVALGRKLALLEGTEAAIPVGSGMAAITLSILALTSAGDHVLASRWLYGATRLLLERELPRRGLAATLVDPSDTMAIREALRPETRLLYLEMPTNPTLRVFDPGPAVELARDAGIPVIMDATFASPVNLRPARLGVDVIVHSATKYLGGHSDLVAGVVAGPSTIVREVEALMRLYGPALDPHAAWLLDRGLKTLGVRVERQNRTALELATWFEGRPEVERVVYPGLPSHPDHLLASRIMVGGGGMVGLVLRGGGSAADRFVRGLELAALAPSLGGVETLVSLPRFTSHRNLAPGEREALDIPDGFVRISVGLEDLTDLRRDFGRALAAAVQDPEPAS